MHGHVVGEHRGLAVDCIVELFVGHGQAEFFEFFVAETFDKHLTKHHLILIGTLLVCGGVGVACQIFLTFLEFRALYLFAVNRCHAVVVAENGAA